MAGALGGPPQAVSAVAIERRACPCRAPRGVRRALRAGDVARPRRPADGGGAGPSVRGAGHRHDPGAADRGHHRRRPDVGGRGAGPGRQAPEPGQPRPRPAAARVRARGRAHRRPAHRVRRQPRPLRRGDRTAQQLGGPGRPRLPARVDHLLLGVVARVGPLRRHVHRPRLSGPDGARPRRLHAGRAGAGLGPLDERLRGDRAVALSRRGPDRRGRGRASAAARAGPVQDARGGCCSPASRRSSASSS